MDRKEQNELDILDIKKLTKFQKRQVVSLVEKFNEDNKETTADSFHVCPKCGKDHPKITKAGRTKGGKQMYLCHECGRRFVEDIGKPSYSSWYDISAWRIFIEDTMQEKTLDELNLPRYCALRVKVYSLSDQDPTDKVRNALRLCEKR